MLSWSRRKVWESMTTVLLGMQLEGMTLTMPSRRRWAKSPALPARSLYPDGFRLLPGDVPAGKPPRPETSGGRRVSGQEEQGLRLRGC